MVLAGMEYNAPFQGINEWIVQFEASAMRNTDVDRVLDMHIAPC